MLAFMYSLMNASYHEQLQGRIPRGSVGNQRQEEESSRITAGISVLDISKRL